MSLQSLPLHDIYWSGENNIIEEFYIPCLRESKEYCRAVGYFSSSILCYIANGLYDFIQNGGYIRILCSVNLSKEDEHAIMVGYDIRRIIEKNIAPEVDALLNCTIPNVKNLCWLIKNRRLDIRVCLRKNTDKSYGLFHEKFGIFKDGVGNSVSFLGSINETMGGWINNEESFEVSQSWIPTLKNRVTQKEERFERLWAGTAESITTYQFPEAALKKLIQFAPEHPIEYVYRISAGIHPNFKPRKCQEDAKDYFISSGFCSLLMMATGSGKTKAAMYSMSQIDAWQTLLILVPSLELLEQWEKDVRLFFPDELLIKIGTTHPEGRRLLFALAQANYSKKAIILSTYKSAIKDFYMDKWKMIRSSSFGLICDEVHNMGATSYQQLMQLDPRYRIGLSATPKRNFDEAGSQLILNYFQNNCFEFSISDALRAKYLVEYYYHVFPVPMDDESWSEYKRLTQRIIKLRLLIGASNDQEEKSEYQEQVDTLLRDRAKLIKLNTNKTQTLLQVFDEVPDQARVLIYGDDKAHLAEISNELTSLGKEHFIYTGDRNPKTERPIMLSEFQKGIRKVLLAVGCLDEGIDIPACDVAVFVSSSTSERQFIQRRGRVLRTAPNKSRAWVYDYLVYPVLDGSVSDEERKRAVSMISSQFERIKLIADDAINGIQARDELEDFLSNRRLNPLDY